MLFPTAIAAHDSAAGSVVAVAALWLSCATRWLDGAITVLVAATCNMWKGCKEPVPNLC